MPPERQETIIPKGIWLYFKRGVTFGQWGRAHPYYWSEIDNEPRIRSDTGNVIWWLANVLTTYMYTGFVVFRCVQKNLDPTVPVGIKIYLRFTVVYYAFPTIFHTNFILKRSSILNLAIQAMKFMTWIEENMSFSAKQLLGRCHFFMAYIFYGFNNISVFVALFAFVAPDSPEMVSSVIPNRSLATRIACGLFQGYIEYTFHSQCFLIIFTFFGCLFPCWAVLREIKTWVLTDLTTRADTFVQIYNSVRLLIQMASDVYLSFVVPGAKFMLIALIVFCTYSAARLSGLIAVSLGIMGFILTIFLIIFFETMAEVYELSMDIKARLKNRGFCDRRTVFGKTLRCLKPIMFWMRSSYYVDKMLVLTIINTIFESAINFLIANPA